MAEQDKNQQFYSQYSSQNSQRVSTQSAKEAIAIKNQVNFQNKKYTNDGNETQRVKNKKDSLNDYKNIICISNNSSEKIIENIEIQVNNTEDQYYLNNNQSQFTEDPKYSPQITSSSKYELYTAQYNQLNNNPQENII